MGLVLFLCVVLCVVCLAVIPIILGCGTIGFMSIGVLVVHGSHEVLRGSLSAMVVPFLSQNLILSLPPLNKLSPVGGFLLSYGEGSDCLLNHALPGYLMFYWALLDSGVFYPVEGVSCLG